MNFSVQLFRRPKQTPEDGTEALTVLYPGDYAPLRSGGLLSQREYEPR